MGFSKLYLSSCVFLVSSLFWAGGVHAASEKSVKSQIRDKLMPHWFDDGTYRGRPNREKSHYDALLDKSRDATPSKYVVSSRWVDYYHQDRIHPKSKKSGILPKIDSATAQVLADSPVKNDDIASVAVVVDDGPYYRIGQQRGYSRLDIEKYGRDSCFRCVSTNLHLAGLDPADYPTRLVPATPAKDAKAKKEDKKKTEAKKAQVKKPDPEKQSKKAPKKEPKKAAAKPEPQKKAEPKPAPKKVEKPKTEPVKKVPEQVAKAPEKAKAAKKPEKKLAPEALKPVVAKTCESTKVKIAPILFEFDSADLPPIYERNLKPYAAALEKKPLAKIDLVGHTDAKGSDTYNLGLGIRRAETVAKYLLANGVAESQIHSSTEGEAKPEGDNKAEKGRAKNRRVVVIEHECDAKS